MILDNIVCNVGDNNQIGTNVNLEGHVHVNDKEAGKSLANHVGIIGGMGVVGGLVGKAVAKAPMPPLAKAGLVVGGAIVGGVVEKVINNSGNIGASSTFSVNNGTISKLVNDSQVSVLQENFFLQEVFYSVVLYMVLLIVIQLIFKLYFKDNVKLNLSKLLGVNFNNKVEYYLNKIILLNKKMSIFWT
jgi:outer membrane lipoprotein SlyB